MARDIVQSECIGGFSAAIYSKYSVYNVIVRINNIKFYIPLNYLLLLLSYTINLTYLHMYIHIYPKTETS